MKCRNKGSFGRLLKYREFLDGLTPDTHFEENKKLKAGDRNQNNVESRNEWKRRRRGETGANMRPRRKRRLPRNAKQEE